MAKLETTPEDAERTVDLTVSQRFLDSIFEPDDWIELRLISPYSDGPPPTSIFGQRDGVLRTRADDLVRSIVEGGFGIYVGANPRIVAGSGTADNVLCWRALFVDFDDVPLSRASEGVDTFHLPEPSIIVSSGGGWHLYWILTTQLGRIEGTALERRLVDALAPYGADLNCRDVARIMRLPGTLNTKPKRKDAPVQLTRCDPAHRYHPSRFFGLPDGSRRKSSTEPVRVPARPVSRLHRSTQQNPVRRARAYLAKVPGAVEGQRGDDHTFRTACRMRDLGLTEDECNLAMSLYWNKRCKPPWNVADLERKVANAYRYGQQ